MKRILALIIAILSAIVFSSCTTVNNNYYDNNGSAASSETVDNSEHDESSQSAKETKPIKEDTSSSAAPVTNTPQSTPKTSTPVFNYNTPFYGIWVYASKSNYEASNFANDVSSNGFNSYIENTTNWSNLNNEEWYVVTAGKYSTENEAKNQLDTVKKKYPDSYVKYSGEYKTSSNSGYSSFYGIWVYASKSYDEAESFSGDVYSNGFNGFVITTTDWSNLNSEKWYVVTAGQYGTEKEANNKLDEVKKYYPDAYVKYSGDHINN